MWTYLLLDSKSKESGYERLQAICFSKKLISISENLENISKVKENVQMNYLKIIMWPYINTITIWIYTLLILYDLWCTYIHTHMHIHMHFMLFTYGHTYKCLFFSRFIYIIIHIFSSNFTISYFITKSECVWNLF